MSKNIICSPYSQINKYSNYSCYTYENLVELKELWNERHPDDLIISDEFDNIYNELKEKTKHMCKNELCWLKELVDNDDDIFNDTFAPIKPIIWEKNDKYWLSNVDIMRVMKQYESIYKNFDFIGPTPLDYDSFSKRKNDWVWRELKEFDLNKYINSNISDIGIVFNLDKHTLPGSHWVALYSDLEKNQVYFFDSYGKKPEKRIRKFVSKIVKFLYDKEFQEDLPLKKILSNLKGGSIKEDIIFNNLKSFDIDYNKVRHQFKNSECGVYSINFILRLLDGQSFKNISLNKTYDDKMNSNRKEYFR